MKWLPLAALTAIALTACDYTEVEHEIGYKGKARTNPWLAAERFAGRMGREVHSVIAWTAPGREDAVWMLPASILSNTSFTRRMEAWVAAGGHLILLVEHADQETNDWLGTHAPPVLEPALVSMLERAGITLDAPQPSRGVTRAEVVEFDGRSFVVHAGSTASVAMADGPPGVFASVRTGHGRITVLADGRLFRNRWIGEHEHAVLLDALLGATGTGGAVGFMRGSGLSLWSMMRAHLAPVLLGGGLWVLLWLWKNLARFGPIEAAVAPPRLRGYEHHLEALGDFQWRLDRAASLLVPLRQQIVELGQRASGCAGGGGGDFFQFLADCAGWPRERVCRALAETVPADPALLTRTAADLQQLLKVLHNPVP